MTEASHSPHRAWVLILVADAGILLYGFLAVATPAMLTAGYESYTGTSCTELAARAPDEAAYLLRVYRLVGGLNVALGITLIAVAVGPFRRGERWAWFTLLGGNVLGFGIPMTYDHITVAIGAFEILEFAAIGAVFMALALSLPRRDGVLSKFGATRAGVWLIGNVISPFQRRVILATGGRITLTGMPVLLLTMIGRRSGRQRKVPLVYLRDHDDLIVCNVRPPSERPNPWPLNVRANRDVTVRIGGTAEPRIAREALPQEIERFWPCLVAPWPAYESFFERTQERAIFVLEVPSSKQT